MITDESGYTSGFETTPCPSPVTQVVDIRKIVETRRAIYVQKLESSDAFADGNFNNYERLSHTIEAFDCLLSELDPPSQPRAIGSE